MGVEGRRGGGGEGLERKEWGSTRDNAEHINNRQVCDPKVAITYIITKTIFSISQSKQTIKTIKLFLQQQSCRSVVAMAVLQCQSIQTKELKVV